jgi:phytoene desaturase
MAPGGSAHHNIHFGRDWDGAFRSVIHDGQLMSDPSVLVSVPSRDDTSLAPPGCSSLYVLEPVPNLDGNVDWSRERDMFANGLRERVAALGYPSDVVTETWFDPRDWANAGMERGTPFAMSHTFRQTGPFRAGNVDTRIPGLAFVGSSTVPGVGVPMALVSGKLAAARVTEHLARSQWTGGR